MPLEVHVVTPEREVWTPAIGILRIEGVEEPIGDFPALGGRALLGERGS